MHIGNEFFVGRPPHQMYVQHHLPGGGTSARPSPLVLIHGWAHTGVCWTSTPDGRPAWGPHLSELGWPVYIVDWPGAGRSGFPPDFPTMGPSPVVEALLALLERTGPACLIGHSFGAALALKIADRAPEYVRAIVALTPGPIANISFALPERPPDVPERFSREDARRFFANSERFPQEAFEEYFSSLVPISGSMGRALWSDGDELLVTRPEVVSERPILFVAADRDQLVPRELSELTASIFGVRPVFTDADWGLPGHGHMLIIEQGNLLLADRVAAWLEEKKC